MSLEIKSVDQCTTESGIKILVYGRSGVGKTVLCATAPDPLIISAEAGLLSLRKANLIKMFGADNDLVNYNSPVIEIDSLEKLIQVYEWCAGSNEAKVYKTICLDSLSEIAEVVLNAAKECAKDPRQAYGELLTRMEAATRKFRDLPNFNVYMAAKEAPVKDGLTGAIKYGPLMPGAKLGPALPYFLSGVYNLNVDKDSQGNTYRYLQTQPTPQYEAKDRSGSLDEREFPNLTNVFNKILRG